MQPKVIKTTPQEDLFRACLDNIINMRHELVKLATAIDWDFLAVKVAPFYASEGRLGVPVRLMVGLHILKHLYNFSDESICENWIQNPYYQYFYGEAYFQHELPIDRSSMTYFRQRVGEDFSVSLLQESLHIAHKLGALETKQIERVVVDTTVQPKAITFPTDAKLRYKAIVELGKLAKQQEVPLRQSYVRVAKKALVASCRYRHAKQMRRAKKVEKKLNTWLGRIIRDVKRKLADKETLQTYFAVVLGKSHAYSSTKTFRLQ